MSIVNTLARIPTLNRAAKAGLDRLPYSLRVIVRSAITNGVRHPPPFADVYDSFDAVPDVRYPAPETRLEFARQGLSLHRDHASGLPILRRDHAMLPLAIGMLGKKQVRVLDFGGSGGIDYVNARAASDADLDYHIVETAATCEAGRKLWPSAPRPTFHEIAPPESERFDIAYSWCAVCYVRDPVATIVGWTRYQPEIVLIAATPFADRPFVRKQGGMYPQWVIGIGELRAAMSAAGYDLTFSAVAGEMEYNVDNFDRAHRVPHNATLLFRRQ